MTVPRPTPTGRSLSTSAPVPVVLNSGARRGPRAGREVTALLESRGVVVGRVVQVASGAELLAALDEVVRESPPLLVVAGGDGTVGAAAERVAGTETVLGVLPAGTANDFARTLELTSLADAAQALVDGQVVDVDLGRVRALDDGAASRTFLNVASCGLSSGVTEMLSPRLKRRLGALAYPVATFRAYRRHVDFDVHLEFPEGDHPPLDLEHVLQVSVGNGRHYGGGNTVAPSASVDDDALDVAVIMRTTMRDHAVHLRRLRDGRVVEHERVLHATTRRVRLRTDHPRPMNLDGEAGPSTPVEITVDRNALHVVIPRTSRAAAHDGVRDGMPA